jgi:hypothetical protein
LLLLAGKNANGQLLPVAPYSLSCKAYLNKQWTAERAEFVNVQRGKNWNLVPSVGLAFGLPSVSFNTGQIASYKQRQSETAAKLKSIDLRYNLMLNEQLNLITIEHNKLEIEQEKMSIIAHENATKAQMWKIYQEAYLKKELKPLDFYAQKLAFEAAQNNYLLAIQQFKIGVLELEKLAHYNMPQEVIYYTDNPECPLEEPRDMMIEPSALPASLFIKPSQGQRVKTNALGD